jgi:beta-xylosidase
MKAYFLAAVLALGSLASQAQQLPKRSGNPLFPGWYADPEVAIFGSQYWIYPTYSAPYEQQVFFDAFSSPDLVTWTKHARILDTARVKWAHRALWAPAIVAKNGRYYLFFGANDYHPEKPNEPPGGIGVAVADHPAGPFKDYLGHPLVGTIENGAQPIDQFVFKDADGQYYLLYGGWQHCNIARLKDDFTGFLPFADGTVFKSITPQNYVEGPLMFRRQGKYYFMWSEGGWTGPDYSVAYAVGDSPFGPFRRVGKILAQDPKVGTGAGHHSVLQVPGTDRWYIVYHRHPLGDPDGNHRVVCIEELHFGKDGLLQPVKLTTQGVAAQPLKP